jgi:hypothetical protein
MLNKPVKANILLDHGFRARLTDFGLTTVMHQTTGFTATASLRGSLRWVFVLSAMLN